MAVTSAIAAVVSAVGGITSSVMQQNQAKKSAKAQARRAEEAQKRADDQFRAANKKSPNLTAIDRRNQEEAQGGVSGNLLTGPGGVDPSLLLLGQNSKLGA